MPPSVLAADLPKRVGYTRLKPRLAAGDIITGLPDPTHPQAGLIIIVGSDLEPISG